MKIPVGYTGSGDSKTGAVIVAIDPTSAERVRELYRSYASGSATEQDQKKGE